MLAARQAKAGQNREASAAPSEGAKSRSKSIIFDDTASEAPSEAPTTRSSLSLLRGGGGKAGVWGALANKMKARESKPAAVVKRYENTYQMKPSEENSLNWPLVETLVGEILESRLKSQQYNGTTCRALAATLSDVIKGRVKKLPPPGRSARHKIVVHTVIGEKLQQSVQVCSRFVWDDNTDNHVTVRYENGSLFAVVTVYAVYFE